MILLWDYKNVGIRKGVEYLRTRLFVIISKWSAGNDLRKTLILTVLRNTIDYGTKFIQNIP